jgi:hypothetical protein
MIEFPKSTKYERVIAKEKFYSHSSISGRLKDSFVSDIQKIILANKIASTTLNIDKGKFFEEIIVIRIILKQRSFNEKILDIIDKSILQYVLFLIEFEGDKMASISYKGKANGKIVLSARFNTNWIRNLPLSLIGNKVDSIYENFLSQVSSGKVKTNSTQDLRERVEEAKDKEKIERQIERLKSQMRKELQFNRQIELNAEIKKLKELL